MCNVQCAMCNMCLLQNDFDFPLLIAHCSLLIRASSVVSGRVLRRETARAPAKKARLAAMSARHKHCWMLNEMLLGREKQKCLGKRCVRPKTGLKQPSVRVGDEARANALSGQLSQN